LPPDDEEDDASYDWYEGGKAYVGDSHLGG